MGFSRQLPLTTVIALCRALRHNLGAGLSLVQVFRQQAERGPRGVRPLAGRILLHLEQGQSLSDALVDEKNHLPPLFFSLVKVAEETGHLAEIFGELENYFLLQDKLRKQFRSQSMMPLIQLGLAFIILAGLIFILGMIGTARNSKPIALFGLSGSGGALAFLVLSFGSCALLWFFTTALGRTARGNPSLDALLLKLPVLGPCLTALVMGRFTMALHITLDSGMAIAQGTPAQLVGHGKRGICTADRNCDAGREDGRTLDGGAGALGAVLG